MGVGRGQLENHAVQPRQMPRHCLGAEPWQPFPQDYGDEGTALWGWPKALSGSELNRGQLQGPKNLCEQGSGPESQGRTGVIPLGSALCR